MKVLVTGASGFIGSELMVRLVGDKQYDSLGAGRRLLTGSAASNQITVGEIDSNTDWSAALLGVDVVVHAAARAHIMDDKVADPLAEFRKINVDGTINLAKQAARAGVKRFVYISSIKVNGENNELGRFYTADDKPAPLDPYGISKMEAEHGLQAIAMETGMEVVIIRPPLVYGPSVRGNFASMLKWVRKGLPLPLGAIHNKRTLVALDNLVDLIITCIQHPAAANQVFLAGDGEDLSTTELLHRVAKAMGQTSRLIPVPVWLLQAGTALLGKKGMADRLCGSLQVDISKARNLLGWQPRVSVDEGLRKAVEGFRHK
jgi:nucleoside-diphosphate-sugar epimerase